MASCLSYTGYYYAPATFGIKLLNCVQNCYPSEQVIILKPLNSECMYLNTGFSPCCMADCTELPKTPSGAALDAALNYFVSDSRQYPRVQVIILKPKLSMYLNTVFSPP